MKVVGGTLHLVSGLKIDLPTQAAVDAATEFWQSIPEGDDVPVTVQLTPNHEVVLVRSSIAAIERRG
jgi:hypothetical protein